MADESDPLTQLYKRGQDYPVGVAADIDRFAKAYDKMACLTAAELQPTISQLIRNCPKSNECEVARLLRYLTDILSVFDLGIRCPRTGKVGMVEFDTSIPHYAADLRLRIRSGAWQGAYTLDDLNTASIAPMRQYQEDKDRLLPIFHELYVYENTFYSDLREKWNKKWYGQSEALGTTPPAAPVSKARHMHRARNERS